MSDFLRMVNQTSNHMASAGRGLETAARLLASNGIKYYLSEEDSLGLIHALLALGETVREASHQLREAVEAEVTERESQE